MKTVYVTGLHGFLGRNVLAAFSKDENCSSIGHSHRALDLTQRRDVLETFKLIKPEVVIHCAGQVGGLFYNREHQYEQLVENTLMSLSVVDACLKAEIPKLIIAGSSCMYPSWYSNPYVISDVWESLPHKDVLGYGLAKRMGFLAGQLSRFNTPMDVVNLVFPNIYGPEDCFDETRCHFVPGLINRIYKAKEANDINVKMFGTGLAERELLYVEDAADACVFAAKHVSKQDFNVGDGRLWQIRDVARFIGNEFRYDGHLEWDPEQTFNENDSQQRKCMESGGFRSMGWSPKVDLLEGLKRTIDFYKSLKRRDKNVALIENVHD